jgi:hypothetical protein
MPSNSASNRKTLQINPEYFKQGKRKGGTSAKNTQKVTRKRASPIKHNTIKRELIKRIQQHKQNEQTDQRQQVTRENKNKQNKTLGSLTSEMETNEFKGAVNYLHVLARSKKKNERAAARQQRAGQSKQVSRTLKSVQPYTPTVPPNVNLDLPQELSQNNLPLHPSYTQTPPMVINTSTPPANINYRIPSYTQISPPSPSPQPQPQPQSLTPPREQLQTSYVVPRNNLTEPPYSNLKTSILKPTYRQWTRKNNRHANTSSKLSSDIVNPPSTNTTSNQSSSFSKNDREHKLRMLQRKFSKDTPTENSNLPSSTKKEAPVMELKRYYEGETNNNDKLSGGKPRKRVIKRTIKKKYTVGKSKINKKVSVLVKNLHTRKKIVDAKKELKQTTMSDIKKYLKARGFIKSGSIAPNNVLRELYESAMMSGDVTNLNTAIQLHNYMDQESDV